MRKDDLDWASGAVVPGRCGEKLFAGAGAACRRCVQTPFPYAVVSFQRRPGTFDHRPVDHLAVKQECALPAIDTGFGGIDHPAGPLCFLLRYTELLVENRDLSRMNAGCSDESESP